MSAANEPKTNPTILDRYTKKQINIHVSRLIGKYGFTKSDLADLEQEVALHILKWMPHHDPEKSTRKTYLKRLIDCKMINIVRHREIRMRFGNAEVLSTEVAQEAEDNPKSEPNHEMVPDADRYEIGIGRRNMTRQKQTELRLDVETILSKLPPHLREACFKLMQQDKSEVAREMGLPEATFYDQVIEPLRVAFQKAGFEKIPLGIPRTPPTCG